MISKSAVREFLAREKSLEDYRSIKELDDDQLMDVMDAALEAEPEFITPPFKHQLACFLVGLIEPQFLFFLDMGLGKSKLVLDLFRYRQQRGAARRMLVLVPNTVNLMSWEQQGAIHRPDVNLVSLYGDTEARRQMIEDGTGDVNVITYAGWMHLCCDKVLHPKKQVNKMQVNAKTAAHLSSRYDMVVWDESTELKNHRGLPFKLAKHFKDVPYRYGLTGTPMGRDPQDLWAQFCAADGGETFGKTLGVFRQAFFNETVNYWGGYEYKLQHGAEDRMARFMAHRSLYYATSECHDLPEQVYTQVSIPFTSEMKAHYAKMIADLRAATNFQEMKNAFIRMRQLSSGFLTLADDDERVIADLEPNMKIEALLELLREIGPDEKVVVFHTFTHSSHKIAETLTKNHIGCSQLYGGTADPGKAVRKFTDTKGCRVLVVNDQVGAKSLNLQCARYVIFYESPVSLINRQQAEKRVHRIGQDRTVFYYDLVVDNTIDAKLLRYLKEGKELFDELVKGEVSV